MAPVGSGAQGGEVSRMSRHDQSFIRDVQQRFTFYDYSAHRLRQLSEREIVNLLDQIEAGRKRDEEIAHDLNLPLDKVTEVYDLWVETYDPAPKPPELDVLEALEQDEWEQPE